MRFSFSVLLCITLTLTLTVSAVHSQEGSQYRSKVLLLPDGGWGEGAELSVEELEAQLGSIEEAYAKSSAGRHLARHYVERKEYDKAIGFYQEALTAEGLSAVANREMLRELAQIYLLKKDYAATARTLQQALAVELVPEVTDYLLLARAYYHQGQYVDVVATLDRMQQPGVILNATQMQQALAMYFHAGAYAQCEALLEQLLKLQPDEPRHWHLMAAVYLKQNKKKQALDQLALARKKRVPFSEQDIVLLASLQATTGNPYGAAELLEAALSQAEIPANALNYRKLFEFWLQAREQSNALRALQQATRLSGDTELYLYLAQLQMEQKDFQSMHQTMLAACADQLEDRFVGRANLLLGISQLKLGDEPGARRSLINATLIGGVNAEAGQWLAFMGAEPVTQREARRIEGICYGARDKRLASSSAAVQSTLEVDSKESVQAAGYDDFQIKTVAPMRLYYTHYKQPLSELAGSLQGSVVDLGKNLMKSGGRIDGPLQLILPEDLSEENNEAALQLGLPFTGVVSSRGKFQVQTTNQFKCAYQRFDGSEEGFLEGLARLAESVQAADHVLDGGARIVISGDSSESLDFELQLGIR